MIIETLTCLAMNIYFEARSESTLGQHAVAQVTMNRVASDKYPNSVCDVVWQSGQFSWTNDGKSDVPKNKEAWEKAKHIAKLTLEDSTRERFFIPPEVLYYHANYVKPYWAKKFVVVKKYGNHIFYRSKT